MSGWERVDSFGREIYYMLEPRHSGDLEWLFFLGFFVLAFALRKELDGCLLAGIKLFMLIVFWLFLQGIHPMAPWIFIGLGLVAYFSGKNWATIKMIIIGLAIFATFCVVVYQNFLV